MAEKKLRGSAYAYGVIKWIVIGSVILLSAGYLLQIFSPLRLTRDSYRLLSMAVSAYNGHGYLVDGKPDQYPLLYPFLVKLMLQIRVASSMTLVALNLVCLSIGLLILRTWSRSEIAFKPASLVIFALSSWIMIEYVTIPATEFLYLAISMASLYFIWRFWSCHGGGKWRYFIFAAFLGYLGFNCRTVGLTIFSTLAIVAMLHQDIYPSACRLFYKKIYVLFAALLFAALSLIVFMAVSRTGWYESQFVRPGSYFRFLIGQIRTEGILTFFILNIHSRILEFGEIFANFQNDRFPDLLPVQYMSGLLSWCIVLYGATELFRRKNLLPLAVYFLSYTALMLTWHWYFARFWLPLIPILSIMFFAGAGVAIRRWPAIRYLLNCYLCVFVVIGICAVVSSARVSLSGKEFSELYAEGDKRMTYRFAFQNGEYVDMARVSEKGVRILRVFEPLAHISPDKD